jgi:hypothetical protein
MVAGEQEKDQEEEGRAESGERKLKGARSLTNGRVARGAAEDAEKKRRSNEGACCQAPKGKRPGDYEDDDDDEDDRRRERCEIGAKACPLISDLRPLLPGEAFQSLRNGAPKPFGGRERPTNPASTRMVTT